MPVAAPRRTAVTDHRLATAYLIGYNAVQLAVWTSALFQILSTIAAPRAASESGSDASSPFLHVYSAAQPFVHFGQTLAWLEVLHVGCRLVSGALAPAFVQSLGRYVILVCVVEAVPSLHASPVTTTLFVVWALGDAVRYAMYVTTLFGLSVPLLRWCRYSAFMLLYPTGIASEWWIYFSTLHYVDEHKLYAVTMPNVWNFAFDFGAWNRVVLCMYVYFGPFMFCHMLRQRHVKLSAPL